MTHSPTSTGLEASAADMAAARLRLAPLPDEEKRVLSALAAIGGGPMDAARLAVLADVPDPSAALDALRDRQLVEAQGSRYSLTGNLAGLLPSIWDLAPWCERALAYFLPWAEARREDPAELLREAGALRHLRDWSARSGRHAEAVRLRQILDPTLAGGLWGGGGVIRIPPVSFRLLPWLGVALLLIVLGGIRFASSRMAEPPAQMQTVVPVANRQPSPRGETRAPRVSNEETTDPTTDLTETPGITTDLPADGAEAETRPEIPQVIEPAPPAPQPERPPIAPIPVLGWCCTSGEVLHSTEGDCKDRKGGFFKGQRAATAACLIVGCCIDGDFKLGETLERCNELGGTYMSAAEVPLRCKAP